jgi:hypothetical protein
MADPSSKFDTIDIDRFIELTYDYNSEELADIYEVGPSSIRRWKKKLRKDGARLGNALFPLATGKIYNDYIKIQTDDFICIGDAEIPNHSNKMFEIAYEICKKYNIKTIIGNGDLFDQTIFSPWPRTEPLLQQFKDEIEPGREIFKKYLEIVDEIIINTGNHEKRLARATKGNITLGDFLKDITGLRFQEYQYCIVEFSDGTHCRVTHPRNYSGTIGSVTRKLHSKFLSNLIIGHDHYQALLFDPSNTHWLVHGGHCRDEKRVNYTNLVDSCNPKWNAGFTMVLNRFPYLINEHNAQFYLER